MNVRTLSCNLKKQIPNTAATKAIKSSVEVTDSSMKTVLIILFIQNVVLKGSMQLILDLVRSLQMILHLPMMMNIIPGNLSMLNSKMIEIAMFDVLPQETTEYFFAYNATKIDEVSKLIVNQL